MYAMKTMTNAMTNVAAINRFFSEPCASGADSAKPSMGEMRALTKGDREELGALCAAELGATIKPVTGFPAQPETVNTATALG